MSKPGDAQKLGLLLLLRQKLLRLFPLDTEVTPVETIGENQQITSPEGDLLVGVFNTFLSFFLLPHYLFYFLEHQISQQAIAANPLVLAGHGAGGSRSRWVMI